MTICHTETDDEIHMISMRKAEPDETDILSRYLYGAPTEGGHESSVSAECDDGLIHGEAFAGFRQ